MAEDVPIGPLALDLGEERGREARGVPLPFSADDEVLLATNQDAKAID